MKVSVIIPHLPGTREKFLRQAIDSVKSQSYKDWELILIEQDAGPTENINAGLAKATGDLVHILHDDDWLTPHSMKYAVKYIADNDFIHGDVIKHWEETGRQVYNEPAVKQIDFRGLLERNPIRVASLYYRREALEHIGGWSPLGNELATHLELLYHHRKLGYVNKAMSYYRVHPEQSGNGEWYKKHGKEVRKKMIAHFYDRIK
jgi:glycosyltransferase involved in cell wall biosynthesis